MKTQITQVSKANNGGSIGTVGYPKSRKTYGYGAPIIAHNWRRGVVSDSGGSTLHEQRKLCGELGDLRKRWAKKLRAPIKKILVDATKNGFLTRKGENEFQGKVLSWIVNLDHGDIVAYYNSIILRILNYYSFVYNRASLMKIIHLLKDSCCRTLARKFKLDTRAAVYKRFGKKLKCPDSGVEFQLPANYKGTGHFQIKAKESQEILESKWFSKLTKTHLNRTCVICGSQPVQMYHVRKIKDIRAKVKNQTLDYFTAQMAGINRKQIPVCLEHHRKIHSKDGLTPGEQKLLEIRITRIH